MNFYLSNYVLFGYNENNNYEYFNLLNLKNIQSRASFCEYAWKNIHRFPLYSSQYWLSFNK